MAAEHDDRGREGRPVARMSRKGARTLQSFIEGALEPTLKAKGFASSAIHLHWAEIVGAELARWSEPVSLKWPPRPPGADPAAARGGATLTVKVEGAFAIDLQHQLQQVADRANRFFGWRCVERVALKQGPVRKAVIAPRRKPELTAESSRRLDEVLAGVEEPKLKAALARLGVGVLGRR